MYWSDWGNHPKIETAAMDGTLRETLVQDNIQWPTGLAVDYHNERLYWADAKLSVIGSIRLNGTDPVVAIDNKKGEQSAVGGGEGGGQQGGGRPVQG